MEKMEKELVEHDECGRFFSPTNIATVSFQSSTELADSAEPGAIYPLAVHDSSFMEELKDTSIHHTALRLAEDVKTMKLYGNLYKMVQVSGKDLGTQECPTNKSILLFYFFGG